MINTDKGKLLTPNFLVLFGAVFLMFSAVDFYVPVMPFYVLQRGGAETAVGLVMALFTFCSVVLRPFQGRDLNRSGRKKLLAAGIALYVAAGLGLLFLPSLPFLYLIRAVQGFGWGAFLLSFNTLTLDLAPPGRSGEAVGLMGMAPPLSLATAPLFGEQLRIITDANYLLLFMVSAFLALIALLLAAQVREPAMQRGEEIKPTLFSRKVLAPSLIIFCMTFNLGVLLTFIPLLGEERSIQAVGYFFTVFAVTTIIVRPLTGRLSDQIGRAKIFIPGLVIAGAAMVVMALAGTTLWLLFSALVFGIGFGAGHSAVMAQAADRLPEVERGVGMATFTTAFDLGIIAGSLVLGVLLNWFSFTTLFILCGLIMVAPALFWLLMRGRKSFNF